MYDVVVVGAGSAGCVVAARLSENPNLRVALLEAGPDYALLRETPFDLINAHNNSYRDHDWGMDYEPTQGRRDRFPRGRVTGGSSAVNTAIALRGVPEDYDEWAAAGNAGWAWEDVLPAFKRLERDLDFPGAPYHGDSGPISIRRHPPGELLPQHQAFLARSADLGYPQCADANAPWDWGAGPQPMNKLGRLRISAAIGYLAPARLRPNLDIISATTVRRAVFAGTKCVGVEVEKPGGEREVFNAKLVVLSGGALMTPCMLLRSGIGDPAEVAHLGVKLLAARTGVGKNLADHPALAVVCDVKDASLIDYDAPLIQTILRYTAPNSDKRCDLQIEQISFANRSAGVPQFAIAPVLEYQYGRGQLTLHSADVQARPQIENRFCEDPRDAQRLANCVLDTLAFTREGPLAEMISGVRFPDLSRGCTLQDIQRLCQKFAGSGYHPCGTAKMGPKEDDQAVVDARGRVYQVENLVVADASIMPSVPRANTNLTCFMIGERIGEWIRTEPHQYGL